MDKEPLSERWKSVIGFEGRYEVSDCGRVRSLLSPRGYPWRQGPRLLTLQTHGQYYWSVVLKPRPEKKRYVHRMVLEAFIGPCPSGWVCDHIDGDGYNNHVTNLRWVPESLNQQRRLGHGGRCCGPSHHNWTGGNRATTVIEDRQLYEERKKQHEQSTRNP